MICLQVQDAYGRPISGATVRVPSRSTPLATSCCTGECVLRRAARAGVTELAVSCAGYLATTVYIPQDQCVAPVVMTPTD